MKKLACFFFCTLLISNCWASAIAELEKAPRIDFNTWDIDDASLKKTAVTMVMYGILFSLATVAACILLPGAAPGETGGSSAPPSGGGIPGL